MKFQKLLLSIVVVTATVLMTASASLAAPVVFEDFETVASGAFPSTSTGTVGGAWADYVSYLTQAIVQDPAAAGIPANPAGGTKFLRNTSISPDSREATLDISPSVIAQLTPGTRIVVEWDVYYRWGIVHLFLTDDSAPGGRGAYLNEVLQDGHGFVALGQVLYRDTTSARTDSGLSYTANTWEHFKVENVIGSNTGTLTLGANSVTVGDFQSLTNVGSGQLGQLIFDVSTGGMGFHDNVSLTIIPEPGRVRVGSVLEFR